MTHNVSKNELIFVAHPDLDPNVIKAIQGYLMTTFPGIRSSALFGKDMGEIGDMLVAESTANELEQITGELIMNYKDYVPVITNDNVEMLRNCKVEFRLIHQTNINGLEMQFDIYNAAEKDVSNQISYKSEEATFDGKRQFSLKYVNGNISADHLSPGPSGVFPMDLFWVVLLGADPSNQVLEFILDESNDVVFGDGDMTHVIKKYDHFINNRKLYVAPQDYYEVYEDGLTT